MKHFNWKKLLPILAALGFVTGMIALPVPAYADSGGDGGGHNAVSVQPPQQSCSNVVFFVSDNSVCYNFPLQCVSITF